MAKLVAKPPAGSRIDWGNPLSAGLIDYWVFNENAGQPRSLTYTNPVPSLDGGSWGASAGGSGRRYTGVSGSRDRWDSVAARNITGAVTVAVGFTPVAANPDCALLVKRESSAAGGGMEWGLFSDAASGVYFTWQNGGSFNSVFDGSLGFVTAGKYMCSVGTRPTAGTSGKLYKNGTLIKTTTGLSAPTSLGIAASFGATNNGTDLLFNGVIHWAGLWNRELSEAEVQALNANPYALLVPVSPRRFYGASNAIIANVIGANIPGQNYGY